jgi:hypothetical protein
MEKEQLFRHLQTGRTKLYCVLDGASVPQLPKRLYDTQAANYCLFTGDLEPDMLYVAPYLVYLSPNNQFTEWIITEGFGKHWGIFAHSVRSIREMRRHFRSLINVYDENAQSLIFRFYDPRVLQKYLPTCNADELGTFFGSVDGYFAESEDGTSLMQYRIAENALKQTELN